MEKPIKNKQKIVRQKLFNMVFLLTFSIILITIYYMANTSKAEEIPEISVNIKNSLQEDDITEYLATAISSSDGQSFYIKLPEYINNNKVIKYSYIVNEIVEDEVVDEETEDTIVAGETGEGEATTESENVVGEVITEGESEAGDDVTTEGEIVIDETTTESETVVEQNEEVQEETDINEIGPNDILPENNIYLTASEVENRTVTIIAHYDTKQVGEQIYYKKLLSYNLGTAKITLTGYMPNEANLIVTQEDEIKDIQTIIRNNAQSPIVIDSVYDIRIKVGENSYAPAEVDEGIEVLIEKEELENKETNVWPVSSGIQTFALGNTATSLYALEDVGATLLAIESMADQVLLVDDAEADKNYWLGKNYTDNISGEYTGTYTDDTLANVTINYYSYAQDEVEPEMVGWVSLTERYNVLTYKKTCPIESGNVTIELIDNPFMDKPTGYGFGGWVSSDGTITTNTKIDVQSITVAGASDITIDVYTNWIEATVVYVNGETGNDNVDDGLTPETAFGSWSKAISYLKANSTNVNDRERNIIVMTGDMATPINYTVPKTYKAVYTSSTTFTPGETYILSNTNTGSGGNAFTAYDATKSNTVLSDTTKPHLATQWKIIAADGGYLLQNAYTGLYFSYAQATPKCLEEPYVWQYDSTKRAFYTPYNGINRYLGWYTNSDPDMWTTAPAEYVGTTYFLKCTSGNTTGTTASNTNYTASTNVAFTLTSLYNHTDYRSTAVMNVSNTSYETMTIHNDFQMYYVNIKSGNYTYMVSGGDEDGPYFIGNNHNVRIGRGMYPLSDSTTASTFATAFGGAISGSVGSTSSSNNAYRFVLESGKYSQIMAYHGYTYTNNYYGTIYSVWGNDIDRVKGDNTQLKAYNRHSTNIGQGTVGHSDATKIAYLVNVKSGSYGLDFVSRNPTNANITYAGIYVGGPGVAASYAKDMSTRNLIVEGGHIYNIIGGLKATSSYCPETRIYIKGGRVENIVGGAGLTTTYGDRIVQVTGGTIGYSISGGSNGISSGSDDGGQVANCDTLVYIGGNAQIGDEANLGKSLYGVEAGCVLGAGNGNTSVAGAGQVDNTHIIIDGEAHILNNVYGGGNYGIVGSSSATSAKSRIDILGGTIENNVYGGANQNNIYGSSTINIKGGHVKGAVYGGSNSKGTISTTSTITVTGGTLGVEGNTTDNPVLFGGGYGASTVVKGATVVNILDTNNNVKIYGSGYGGSSLGKMSSSVKVNIKDSPSIENTIDINGYIFAGGKGSSSTAATIAGAATLEVDGANLPNCSVFGGNDVNGTTSGNITVNIGRTYKSTVAGVYGGGNKANITTTTPNVKVYLMTNADVTNAFNGGKAANLVSSGATDTTRAIYLQGGNATNLFGGSDSSGTVTASHVYIQSGTAKNVYGGNNIGGVTTTSNVSVTGGTIENVYGGGYQASTTASNVSLTGGNITNGFGGGNAANVTSTSITLNGTNSTNIYGGSNQQGTVNSTYVTINSGTAKNVYGGNNAGGNAVDTEVIVNSTVKNVYGGGNEAVTSGTTNVLLTNATIEENAFGGGNGVAAIVMGNSTITAEGTTTITGDLFGGGNAAANGSTSSNAVTNVNITGATIYGDVYGAANTSVVNGDANVKIGMTAVGDTSRTKGTIHIAGTVFGGGKSNKAGEDDYDYNFESVTGDVMVYIDGSNYDDGTHSINIYGSIFGSGNAAKISGDGYINIANYGSASNLKTNVSIQRATRVKMNNCGIYLSGTTDRTNEISTAVYTLNRIKELVVKNNTTIYLESGANLVEKLTSVDNNESKATVTIGSNGVTSRNVDNRIYLSQGKNLILRTEDDAHGEVSGMTYIGLYKGTVNRETGIFDVNYTHGDTVAEDEEDFTRNSYVQGKHYESHNIEVDGFYTNYNEDGIINTKYIEPTPETGPYYQWIIGKPTDDIYYEEIELIATKYATTSTHVLELTGLNYPNMVLEVVGFETQDLKEGVQFIDPNDIPNVEMNKDRANNVFGLTMTTGNVGWQTNGSTQYYTTDNHAEGKCLGTTQYVSENSTTTPSFSIYMSNAKNISETEKIGTVTLKLQAKYLENEEMIIRNVFIVLNISTNNTIKLANDYYEGAITPGKEYNIFPTTNTNITSNSSFSAYYSLFLSNYSTDENYYYNEEEETGIVGYYHCLVSSCVLPAKTKIVMIDKSKSPTKYYYYIVTEADETAQKKEFKFTEFTDMGSTNEKYDSDLSYYIEELDIVLEEYIFHVDFEDITLADSLEQETLTVEMRDIWDDTMKLNVNKEQYPMMYNVYSDKEAIKDVDATTNKEYIYMGDTFKVNLSTEYTYQKYDSEIVYDTRNFEDQLGVKVTILEGSVPLTASELTGIYIEHNGEKYFARHDGTYRMKIADTVSNVLTEMTFCTENGNLDTAAYTIEFETFGSIDGVYYTNAIAKDSVNMLIINSDYGLTADLDEKSVLIDKETGYTQNNNNTLDFTIGFQAEFTDPRIYVSLQRRDYSSIYSSTYGMVDLQEYVTTELTTAALEKQYLVTDNPQETQKFTLQLKNNLVTGTYKIVFSLYDGDNYIGNVEKMIIIK